MIVLFQICKVSVNNCKKNDAILYYRVRSNKDISSEKTFMISDTQIFVALILALVSLALAIRLGTSLYQ